MSMQCKQIWLNLKYLIILIFLKSEKQFNNLWFVFMKGNRKSNTHGVFALSWKAIILIFFFVPYDKKNIAWMFEKYKDLFSQKIRISLGRCLWEIWFFLGGGINLYISLTIMQLMYLEHAKYNTLSVMINFYWTHLFEPVSAFRLEHWPVHSSHWSALSLTWSSSMSTTVLFAIHVAHLWSAGVSPGTPDSSQLSCWLRSSW